MKFINEKFSQSNLIQRFGCLAILIIVLGIGSTLLYRENFVFRMFVNFTGCLVLGKCEYKQPLLSKNINSIRNFNDSTQFPYQATNERRESILASHQNVQAGMNGDEVLSIMGNPDEADMLAFVGDPPRAWIWEYNFYKKMERSPNDSDKYIHIYFDANGKVYDIKVK
jgi:hypothetical protein